MTADPLTPEEEADLRGPSPRYVQNVVARLLATVDATRAAHTPRAGDGPWFPESPQEWLDAALVPFIERAWAEASRPRSEDGHLTGTGDLTVADWRRLAAAHAALRDSEDGT